MDFDDTDTDETDLIAHSALDRAAAMIRGYAKTLPDTPGVYRMLGDKEQVLYVGKAKALRRRVLSYAKIEGLTRRIQRMLCQLGSMEFVHTHTEAEALLLESNLIKKLKPAYNILLRDDKSFPEIFVSTAHDFPTVLKHRGAHNRKGEYFGPFAGVGDVNRTIAMLQRVFMLRNCTDSYFAQRQRPCLQYHIKRCTAPCVGMVSKDDYALQINEALAFLKGRSRDVQERMLAAMQEASARMDYEKAASYRDRVKALTSIQSTQDINVGGIAEADVFALAQKNGKSCVQVFFFRAGQNFGNRCYFPRHHAEEAPESILSAFIAQFYAGRPLPREVIISQAIEDKTWLQEALSAKAKKPVKISQAGRGKRGRLLEFVQKNAQAALERHLLESASELRMLGAVAERFNLSDIPSRIEVYDNSHISGTNMVGAMIVAGPEGFRKNAYRKFNIKQAEAADDFGMMREVLSRRFTRALKEKDVDADWPDVVVIDGGQGQYNAVRDVMEELGVLDSLTLVAIAKGPDRNAGRETFFSAQGSFTLPPGDALLHYFQRLRDEAHRFAIAAHRARRQADITRSPLDEIEGIGAKRKKDLLHHFGSAKAVAEAGIDDLQKAPGISKRIAQKIYDHFH